jgi:uncharacterized protein (DUF169 family)
MATDLARLEQLLTHHLTLSRRPVAIAARDTAPAGVARFSGSLPSGCSFWKLASEGRSFYTVPSDHYNCPIGSYTHNIPLPQAREPELTETLSLMAQIGYIRMEEIPAIPRLPATPGVIVYSPLGDAPVDPDTVIVSGRPGSLMLLHEAALRNDMTVSQMLGRPTCMAIPATLTSSLATSLGCIGNRIYTDLPDEELYTAIAGRSLVAIVEQLETIASANAALRDRHRTQKAQLTSIVTTAL